MVEELEQMCLKFWWEQEMKNEELEIRKEWGMENENFRNDEGGIKSDKLEMN